MAQSERDVPTEAIVKSKSNIIVQVAGHKLTLPVATVVLAILSALCTAYKVVAADREAIISRLSAQECKLSEQDRKLELEQVMLMEIRTQLVRIDARVADVQVVLMRGNR